MTQEALLERMGSVDSDYAERYSHATVSRWESGGTRPTLQQLKGGQVLEKLTPREREILKMFAGGKTYAAIAEARGTGRPASGTPSIASRRSWQTTRTRSS